MQGKSSKPEMFGPRKKRHRDRPIPKIPSYMIRPSETYAEARARLSARMTKKS